MKNTFYKPYIAIAIGVTAISSSAILVRYSSADSGVMAFYRLLFSSLMLLPLFFRGAIKEVRSFRLKEWLLSLVSGVFLAFHFILWFESLRYTSVASSTVLVTMQPLFAFIAAFILFKERVTAGVFFSIILAIGGSIVIGAGDFTAEGTALYGDALALLSCALITAYFMIGQILRKKVGLTAYTFTVYSMSAVVLGFYVWLKGEAFGPYPPAEWVIFLLLAIIPTLFGHSLLNWALGWVSGTTISMAILFEPVGASVLAYYLLHEHIKVAQLIGSAMILFGLGLFILISNRKRKIQVRKVSD
ncbi:membrane protein [Bacillus sp. FJAT-27916]|uniref:DMT family transporter n=1 Tax=Bacillaceae TaxID=186817 RepID=UPI0006716060|nr:EamA family transporter [Bacillus sp. FJAT-27916]KMY43398.1 membrane protein [Bacillus sp. FJAT-27916]